MSAPVFLRRSGGTLLPVNAASAEAIEAIPHGVIVQARITRQRNGKRHRLYWATLGETVKATGIAANAYKLHEMLLVATGHTSFLNVPGRGVVETIDRTGWDAMGEEAFAPYFEASMAKLAAWIGTDPLALAKEESADA